MSYGRYFPVKSVISARRPMRETLLLATIFAIDAGVCCGVLYWLFARFEVPGVVWAIVSAILVLIPDLQQSMATALARVAANVVGAVVGLMVGYKLGEGPGAVVVAVVVVSYVCHLLRIDLGLRTAAVSVVIVMTARSGQLVTSGMDRFVSVLAGCGVGVSVQLITLAVQNAVAKRWGGSGGKREVGEEEAGTTE